MSAKVTWLGEEDGPEKILLHGIIFVEGKAVEVTDDIAIRLFGNPFFRREDIAPAPNPVESPSPAVPPKSAPAKA